MWFILVPVVTRVLVTVVTFLVIGVVLLVDHFTYHATLADNPSNVVADDPLTVSQARSIGWPTGRDDGSQAFYLYLGADFVWPSWISCEDKICLVGAGDRVVLYDLYPRISALAELEYNKGDKPFRTLVDELDLTEDQAARLLTPR